MGEIRGSFARKQLLAFSRTLSARTESIAQEKLAIPEI
jgi:hypothetical protein